MLEGGTAMDGAIAALFCNGVHHSQAMGIGGGFTMTYYQVTHSLQTLTVRLRIRLHIWFILYYN